MTYKVVLTHLAMDADGGGRAQIGIALAHRFSGQVFGLYTVRPASPPVVGRALSLYLDIAAQSAAKAMPEVRHAVAQRCEALAIPLDWQMSALDPVEALEGAAMYADIAVVSQTELHSVEDAIGRHMPEHLALHAGIPVLVLPRGYREVEVPCKRVMIAWKATREAANAVRQGLPMLHRAAMVALVVVAGDEAQAASAVACQGYLARHGIKADLVLAEGDSRHPAAALHRIAEERSCDLMVMGLYGHARLKELVLGGASQEMLAHGKLPLLVSH